MNKLNFRNKTYKMSKADILYKIDENGKVTTASIDNLHRWYRSIYSEREIINYVKIGYMIEYTS